MPHDIADVTINPPKTRRPSGRPKDKRIPSTGEVHAPKKPKVVPNKCGCCGGTSHNRTRFVVPI
ncbi:unnamed protein product [Brassica oleracea]|uniref:Uncharacterized protein n=2 Tax=Brassica TaxID=3705 RepID=A0A3P6CJL6_BRAOL|nr:unnamed protein product [Brassica napus]VDD10141.1 unnamed protein product [Brassica oleracea]